MILEISIIIIVIGVVVYLLRKKIKKVVEEILHPEHPLWWLLPSGRQEEFRRKRQIRENKIKIQKEQLYLKQHGFHVRNLSHPDFEKLNKIIHTHQLSKVVRGTFDNLDQLIKLLEKKTRQNIEAEAIKGSLDKLRKMIK